MTPAMFGSVMAKKLLNVEAPSISAASYISLGIAARPARNVMVQNGVPCQMTAANRAQMAMSGSARNRIGRSMKPSCCSSVFRTPLISL